MDFQIHNPKQLIPEAEYRPVAVLWLKFGSTKSQSQLRPSAIARLIMDFGQVIKEFGGVVRLRQDGLTAVFGLPFVAENDVIQAAMAAHQIIQKSQADSLNVIIPIQIGISYDFVTLTKIQEISGNTLRIIGDALDHAEELAALAPSSKTYVTHKVHNATTYYFTYGSAVTVQQNEDPVWELGDPLAEPNSARGLPGIHTRYIGRVQSKESMLELAQNLERDLGGIIWIQGEAGIGKSRLMREFRSDVILSTTPYIWTGSCTAQRSDQAFSLFASLFANMFGIQATDTTAQIHQKISDGISKWPRDARNTKPYIEFIVGVEPDDPNFEKMQPEQLRQQTFVAVRRLLKTLVKERPVIFFLDDLHWIDPLSAELLLFIATVVVSDAILFVCAQRLQGADSPNDRLLRLQNLLPGQTKQLFLEKLPEEDSLQLLRELISHAQLPDEFYALTVSRSEGNPYFIEEFVRMLIEQEYLQQVENYWQLNVPITQLAEMIPMSLNSLIHARMDALPSDLKRAVQYAAVIGFEFDATLLQTITETSNIQQTLQRLANRMLVSRIEASEEWQFSHALFHAIVYQSFSAESRQKLHLRIAQALEQQQVGESTELAAALAYHFGRAKKYDQAIPYLILAGEKAASRSAIEEAVSHFQQAEKYLSILESTHPAWQWRIGIGLGEAYRILGLFDESTTVLEKLIPLAKEQPEYPYTKLLMLLGKTARKLGQYDIGRRYLMRARDIMLSNFATRTDVKEGPQILTELGWVYFAQGELEQARRLGEEGLELAKEINDLNEMADAENLLGGICYQSGDWQGAMHHTMRSMVFREQMQYSWAVARTYSNLGILAYVAGHWPKAIDYFERSLALRQEMGDVEGMAITHNNLGHPLRGQGKLDLAEVHYQESLDISELFNISDMVVNARSGLTQIFLWQNRLDEARMHLSQALSLAQSIGAKEKLAELYRIQAEFSFAKGSFAEGLIEAKKAANIASDVGNKVYEASALRIASKISLHLNDLDSAQTYLAKAKEALVGTMDELENGQMMTQSYRIQLALNNSIAAKADYAVAESIFLRLGANYHLQVLEKLRQEFVNKA